MPSHIVQHCREEFGDREQDYAQRIELDTTHSRIGVGIIPFTLRIRHLRRISASRWKSFRSLRGPPKVDREGFGGHRVSRGMRTASSHSWVLSIGGANTKWGRRLFS